MTEGQESGGASRFSQLAPALIGLLGVVVGAAATSGVAYLGDHRRAKAEETGAERLVLAEVVSDDLVATASPLHRRLLVDGIWIAERERLARSLNNAEWAWVAKYYRDLAHVKSSRASVAGVVADEYCTLEALNVTSYYPSALNGLRRNANCKDKPQTL